MVNGVYSALLSQAYDPLKMFFRAGIEGEKESMFPTRGKCRYKAAIGFNTEQLYYDISNTAYLIADRLNADDENKRHHIFDICQDQSRDFVTRVLNLAFYEIVQRLSTRIEVDATGGAIFDEVAEYGIAMSVPCEYPKHTIWYIRNLIHTYMLLRVFVEFLKLLDEELYRVLYADVEDVLAKFDDAIKSKKKITLRPSRPF